jgi:hypothetical protein
MPPMARDTAGGVEASRTRALVVHAGAVRADPVALWAGPGAPRVRGAAAAAPRRVMSGGGTAPAPASVGSEHVRHGGGGGKSEHLHCDWLSAGGCGRRRGGAAGGMRGGGAARPAQTQQGTSAVLVANIQP